MENGCFCSFKKTCQKQLDSIIYFFQKTAIFSIILLIFFQANLNAQDVNIEYTYKHYTINDGLAQMQVMSLYQDSKGYLWCSTKAGVSRFDGKNFKNFTKGLVNLKGYEIPNFGENSNQQLFIWGQEDYYLFKEDQFSIHTYPDDFIRTYSSHPSKFTGLLEIINKSSGKRAVLNYEKPDSMYIIDIDPRLGNIIYFDKNDRNLIWQTNFDSIYISDLYQQERVKAYKNPGDILGIVSSDKSIYGISSNSCIYEISGGRFKKVLSTQLDNKYFKAIPTPEDDGFIIMTDKDLYFYKDELRVIKNDLSFIRDILFDNSGNLWVATEEGLYNFFDLNFTNYTFGMGNKDWVWSVIEDDNENMWFASYQNGIWSWDGQHVTNYTDKINTQLRPDLKTDNNWSEYRYYMGASKLGNTLYFPTEYDVLQYDGNNFSPVPGLKIWPYEITKTYPDGTVLFGGVPGLYVRDPADRTEYWSDEQLQISSVVNVERDKYGHWVALGKEGIAIIQEDSIVHFNDVSFFNRYCSTKDHKDNIWIGGIGGFDLFTGDSMIHIPGYIDEVVYSLLFVEPQYLLIGGVKGLYLANLNDYYKDSVFEWILFNQNNGFTGVECGKNGFFSDSKGYVWIPTSDLVTRFDPQKLINKKVSVPGVFLKAKISSDNINWITIDTNEEKELNSDFNNIKFTVDAISLSNAGNFRYYYQLDGLQDNWSEAVIIPEFTFHHLRYGNYTFRAKVDAGVRSSSSDILQMEFRIQRPFWFTWWFAVCIVLLIGFSVFLLVRILSIRIRKKELTKKRIVQLRSEAMKAQMNPHLIHNALNNINGLINLGRNDEAQEFLTAFSYMLRQVLKSTNRDEISLAEEFEIVESFIAFHSHAHSNEINYKIVNDSDLSFSDILIPPMLIQPFVENAILHGILPLKERKGFINIQVQTKGDRLTLIIEDNGVGMGKSKRKGSGLGIKLTDERIQLLDSKQTPKIEFHSLSPGTQVVVNIPLKFIEEC
jgi:two-component sensor histidine kinase